MKSMTGFGKGEAENDEVLIQLELRTVNNRYRDIQLKMPNYLNYLDDKIRNFIKEKIRRGRIDVYVKVRKKSSAKPRLEVDLPLAASTKTALESVREAAEIKGEITLADILRNEEILTFEEVALNEETLWTTVQEALSIAIDKVQTMRSYEGAKLQEDLVEQIRIMEEQVELVTARAPFLVSEYMTKVRQKIEEILDGVPLEEEKLLNEVAYYAEKSDINEELVRLNSHIAQFRENLKEEGEVGKKLDFIAQEMNREINTISSKSNDISITKNVIELKAVVEKIREQVQNVE